MIMEPFDIGKFITEVYSTSEVAICGFYYSNKEFIDDFCGKAVIVLPITIGLIKYMTSGEQRQEERKYMEQKQPRDTNFDM